MPVCEYCDGQFDSAQLVSAHLEGCKTYKQNHSKTSSKTTVHAALRQPLPTRQRSRHNSQSESSASLESIRNQLEAEQLQLKISEVRAAHRDLDKQNVGAGNEVQKEAQQEQLRKKRREIIQKVKDTVISTGAQKIPNELKTEAKSAIEAELSTMRVEELPESELIEIAESIRDEIYDSWIEEEKAKDKTRLKRLVLKNYGNEYARKIVYEEIDLSSQSECLQEIETELEEVLVGDESQSEVRELVGSILDDMLEDDIEDDEE